MKIRNDRGIYSQPTFKGYGARPLKGLFLRYTTAAQDNFLKIAAYLEQIGKTQGFDVFVQGNNGIVSKNLNTLSEQTTPIRGGSEYIWVQDNLTFLPQNILENPKVVAPLNSAVSKFFKISENFSKKHIAGGNYYITENGNKKSILLGADNISDLEYLYRNTGINTVNIISQADFHIDLFIRPLRNNVVLVADDKIWLDKVSKGIEKIEKDETLINNPKTRKVCEKLKEIKRLLTIMNAPIAGGRYAPLSKVYEELAHAGYKPVKVPGRIFEYINCEDGLLPSHILNYMNGIVQVNKNDELVYITNKSDLNKYCGITKSVAEKIGFDFNSEFIESVKDYIKPENIYFIDTKRFLRRYQGGIHCLVSEIPQFSAKA